MIKIFKRYNGGMSNLFGAFRVILLFRKFAFFWPDFFSDVHPLMEWKGMVIRSLLDYYYF